MKLCVIGGGKMAEALVGGLINTGWADTSEIGIIEISEARRADLAGIFPGVALAGSFETADFPMKDVLLAVKPQHVRSVADSLKAADVGAPERILSIAAGLRISTLSDWFGASTSIIRAMPNTPALVGKGASAVICPRKDDEAWALSILQAVGTAYVTDEGKIDAVTSLSGCGPAYLFLLAEAMTASAVSNGLDREDADKLTRQTLLGSSTLLAESAESAEQLRKNVTSPNGVTHEAIKYMQENGLERIVGDGMTAAVNRSRELGAKSDE